MTMSTLGVFHGPRHVGTLRLEKQGRFTFTYASHWITRQDAFPLSLSLPLQEGLFPDDQARPFFANILPEQNIRRTIARRLGISEKNDFALLEALGGECAGAISVLPEGMTPEKLSQSYVLLDDAALESLVNELPRRPLLAGEEGIRLSLAGAQDKLPVKYESGQISLPLDGAPSTHILKIPIPGYEETVYNEAFSMHLARRMGLLVPRCEVLQCGRTSAYLVERFDRIRQGEEIARLHQEDFCQALGILPEIKYEIEGGPGFAACIHAIRQSCTVPVKDVKRFLEWIAFNFLLGNADAHAKNISFLYTGKTVALAPFYDLMCTQVYGKQLTDRMAMAIGKERRLDWVMPRHWRRCAEEMGLKAQVLKKTVLNMTAKLQEHTMEEAEDFKDVYGRHPLCEKIAEHVITRARKTQTHFDLEK